MSIARSLTAVFVVASWLALLCPSASAQRDALLELARRVKQDDVVSANQLAHYVRCFQDATFQDPRVFAFHVVAQPATNDAIELTGYIEFREIREALLDYLGYLGFTSIRDNTSQLPAQQLGAQCFGFVRSLHALVRTQPTDSAETATDTLRGEPLFLLQEFANGFLLVHTCEGYLGFIHSRHVLRVDANTFQDYQSGKQVRVLRDTYAGESLRLPAGARFKWAGQSDDQVIIKLTDGSQFATPRKSATIISDLPGPAIERALTTAQRFLGTSYLWGGKTKAGIDCSGLVQTSFATSGIYLPRDSNQQVIGGRLTATRWYRKGLRRGDTLYFLGTSGRITHTGIYLGDDQYIEAVTPAVRISSLSRNDTNYSQRGDKTLAFAKRLVDQMAAD